MDKRYTVFVSSTYKDLVDARWAVARAFMRLNLIPLGMGAFTASDKSQWEIIKKTIDLSDYYVLILGNCYGSIDPEAKISYTEKEYCYAIGQGIPCLTFISKDVPLKPEHRESDIHVEKLDALRAKVSAGRMVDFWTNADDLTGKVATALVMAQMETPRPGWVRNPQTSPEVAEELARLSRRNADLEEKLSSFESSVPKIDSELLDGKVQFIHNGSDEGDLKLIIRARNVGNIPVRRIGISMKIEPVDKKVIRPISIQSRFHDLAPGEYIDIAIPVEDLNLSAFPQQVKLTYMITALNISSPMERIIESKVDFYEYGEYEHYQ